MDKPELAMRQHSFMYKSWLLAKQSDSGGHVLYVHVQTVIILVSNLRAENDNVTSNINTVDHS